MTSKKIKEEIQKIYPRVYMYDVHCIALPGYDNYKEYRVDTDEFPEKHCIIGKGRTEKKAWLDAQKTIKENENSK